MAKRKKKPEAFTYLALVLPGQLAVPHTGVPDEPTDTLESRWADYQKSTRASKQTKPTTKQTTRR